MRQLQEHERSMHENDWKVITAEAEYNAARLLRVQAYKYDGQIEVLIADTLQATAFRLDPEVLARTTAHDLRDVVAGAVYEVDVQRGKASA